MEIVGNYENAFQIMSSDKLSQLILLSKRQHIRLAPKYMGTIRFGIACHMSCALDKFNKELEGAPIAYKNTKITQRLGKIIGEQTCIHFDVDADFIVFKPSVGKILKGLINKVTKEHLGCVVHGRFNAWMLHTCATEKVAIDTLMGSEVEFQVESINTNFGVMSMRGKLTKLLSQPCGLYGLDLIKLEPDKTENKKSRRNRKTKHNNDAGLTNVSTISKSTDEAETSMRESNYANESVLAGNAGDPHASLIQDSSDLEPIISSTQVEPARSSKKKKKHKKNKADKIITDISAIESFNASEEDLRENGVHEVSNPHKKKKKKLKRNDDGDRSEITQFVEEVNTNESDSGVSSDRTKRKRKLKQEQTSDNVNKAADIVPKKKHKKSEKRSS
ncbi:DNA-directed RNA polymerase I subunit RPA43-like [Dreissena polymorpha]|uniref:DNA-directed RNA polymerase I subunit RPA43 n=1 Tax=Dreissena polymorpha TaxID=45954 RepID=A0A9D4N5V3_DREPO|nr:DNA-directed RNA polymerase I subunit RPA43-like [Dreissena polymorpha]KAH3888416.1 hypothetical protein DPMN_012451 [Dreissena polymorpha]